MDMSNRRFEMYQYRNVIHRMRMGESDRTIALTKLMGRGKCKQVRLIAEQNGWLGKEPLPDDETLAAAFEIKPEVNPTQGVILGVRSWLITFGNHLYRRRRKFDNSRPDSPVTLLPESSMGALMSMGCQLSAGGGQDDSSPLRALTHVIPDCKIKKLQTCSSCESSVQKRGI